MWQRYGGNSSLHVHCTQTPLKSAAFIFMTTLANNKWIDFTS